MPNGSGVFAILESDVDQIFRKSSLLEKKTLTNRNLVASRHITNKRENVSLLVDVRVSLKNVST